MATPPDASGDDKSRIEQEYRTAWSRHAEAVTAAGLDYDTTVPDDLPAGADRQLWRLDGGDWHSDPLVPQE